MQKPKYTHAQAMAILETLDATLRTGGEDAVSVAIANELRNVKHPAWAPGVKLSVMVRK
jgi:hypothetical protein